MTSAIAEPTLGDVLHALWRERVSLAVGAFLGFAAAVLFLFFAVPHYRVTMLVGPAGPVPQAEIKALLPDHPGFAPQDTATAAGPQDSGDFVRFENILRGPTVAGALLKDRKIAEGMAHNGGFIFSGAEDVQTAQDLSGLLQKQIDIEPVGNTPLRRITIDHVSPAFGVYLLNRIYSQADALIRDDARARAHRRAAYLQEMLGRVNNPDHRRALTALLMEQEHLQMILGADEPYAAMIAEAPGISAKPWWPRKSLILTGFILAGMALGLFLRGARR